MESRSEQTIEAREEDVFHDISNVVGNIRNSNPHSAKKKRNLTDEERQAVYQALLIRVKHPEPPYVLVRGALSKVAALFGVTLDTISAIWKRGQLSLAEGHIAAVVSSKRRGRVGRKRKVLDLDKLKEIPLSNRKNIRSTAAHMNIPKTTLHRRFQEGSIKRHSNTMKPLLTKENKIARVQFCLSMLDPAHPSQFQDMMDRIHIDEKWFYLTETKATFYMAMDEEPPLRMTRNKRFIPKIMFLAAVARPRWDTIKNRRFDGKIGIFPFLFQEPAQRASKNRARGTMVSKAIENVTKEVVKSMLIEKLIPAIQQKWPRAWVGKTTIGNNIIVQQDNAKPHLTGNEPDLAAALKQNGFNITLSCQPPNSPDMNVLDLGLFRAIQSLQHGLPQKDIDSLIHATENAFWSMEEEKLNNIFLSWQQCMVQVMQFDGSNHYQQLHMGKEKMQRRGELPITLQCPDDTIKHAHSFISSNH